MALGLAFSSGLPLLRASTFRAFGRLAQLEHCLIVKNVGASRDNLASSSALSNRRDRTRSDRIGACKDAVANITLGGGQTGLYRMVLTMESHPAIGLQAIHRPYQKRTKYRQIYRFLPLLTLSNLFRVNSQWVDGDRVKMALYR